MSCTRFWAAVGLAFAIGVAVIVIVSTGHVAVCAASEINGVTIYNYLNDPVSTNCQSDQADLGVAVVLPQKIYNSPYHFVIYPSPFGTTLIYCQFYWRQFYQELLVWTGSNYTNQYPCASESAGCFWKIEARGFSMMQTQDTSNIAETWVFMKSWNQG